MKPEDEQIPVVDAYHHDDLFYLYCEHERRWHIHGYEEGHRSAHCICQQSPYKDAGYVLRDAGPVDRSMWRRIMTSDRRIRPKKCLCSTKVPAI